MNTEWLEICKQVAQERAHLEAVQGWHVASDQPLFFEYRWEHVQAVVGLAIHLAEQLDADCEVMEAAAWLHDICKMAPQHALVGAAEASVVLADTDFPPHKIAAVVDAIGAERVILVGHSMGGPVAVEAAELLGDRVIGIVGVDTFYTDFEYPRDEAKIAEFVKPFENNFTGTSQYLVRSMFTAHADPETIDWVVSQFSGDRRDMGVSAMYEIFRWNADNVPAILQRNAARLRNINGAPTGKETAHDPSVTLIPQVGHFVAQAKPDAFNQALERIIVDDLARH